MKMYEDEGGYRVNISGTPCVHWSQMGSRSGWLGHSALPFVAWILERRHECEDLIIHECTALFPERQLAKYMAATHDVHSQILSPKHFGWPATRERKYSLLVRRSVLSLALPYSLEEGFGDLFFSNVEMDADVFFCAPESVVQTHLAERCSTEAKGAVAARDTLDQSRLRRLEKYEAAAQESHLIDSSSYVRCIISNLDQNVEMMSSLPCMMSCLLTRGVP